MSIHFDGITVDVIRGKNIVKSAKVGTTTIADIKRLTTEILSLSKSFPNGWGYIVDISKMEPVSPEVSAQLVAMTKAILAGGCKAMAFIEGSSFMLAAQAKAHQKQSASSIPEGHFATEAEAIKWMEGWV